MKASPLTTAAALLAGLATGLAVETPVQPQIDSVGLFKNGVAVVRASFTVPGPGTYRWDAVPQTIHGTFAVDSDAVLSTTATHRIVEEELKSAPHAPRRTADRHHLRHGCRHPRRPNLARNPGPQRVGGGGWVLHARRQRAGSPRPTGSGGASA